MPVLLQLIMMGLVAIAGIAALAAWLYPNPTAENISETEFSRALAEHEFEVRLGEILLAADGQAAIAKLRDDTRLAVLRRMGDAHSVRLLPSPAIRIRGTDLIFTDFTWPTIHFDKAESTLISRWLNETGVSAHAA